MLFCGASRQFLFQQAAIGQIGERVVVGHTLDARLVLLALGDVHVGGTHTDLPAVFVVHRGADVGEPADGAVLGDEAQVEAFRITALVDVMDVTVPAWSIVRVDQTVHQVGLVEERLLTVAGKGQAGGGNVFVLAVDPAQVDEFLRDVDDGAKPLRLLSQAPAQRRHAAEQ